MIERIGPDAVPYCQEVRQLYYEAWAFMCNRNYTRTVSYVTSLLNHLVSQDPDVLSYYELNSTDEVKVVTIRRWAQVDKWMDRYHDQIYNMIPEIRDNVFRELFLGLPEAIESTRAIGRGEFEDPKKAAVQLKANEMIFDRTGFTPRLTNDLPAPPLVKQTLQELKDRPIDELMEIDGFVRDGEYQLSQITPGG